MDKIKIANTFIDVFSDTGINLAENIKCMKPDNLPDYMSMLNELSIYLYPCTSGEIESITKRLSNTKAIGFDGFWMKVIKYIIKDIYVPISEAANSSFLAAVFPDDLTNVVWSKMINNSLCE